MLRTRLLTATAAVALFAAGSVLAQTAPAQDAMPPQTPPIEAPAPTAEPEMTSAMPEAAAAPAAQNTVVDVLRANGQFTTLLGALDAAQLTDTLKTQSAVSIFAPTDAAFAALPDAERERLMDPANVNELRQILLYHVVVADVNSSQIEGARGGVQTAANTEVQLDGTGGAIKVDNATVTTADIDAGNGSIFIIDRVLNPANSLVASGDAEEAAAPAADEATPPADEADVTAPAAEDDMNEATPPAASATDAPVPAAPETTAPVAAPMAAPTAPMTSTRPAAGEIAPTGEPATTTTTIASPPVTNPTDGQVDDEDDTDVPATPAPRPEA